jgi:predicted anti-sigma-YlaC factor YlaD
MGVVQNADCERAHRWMSLALDGELSEVEQVLLRAHVGRCAACAGFERDMDALTRELRTAPLERSAVACMPPRRRSVAMRSLQVGAAAAAVALAAGLGSLAGSLHSHNAPAFTTATTGSTGAVALAPGRQLPGGRGGRSIAL